MRSPIPVTDFDQSAAELAEAVTLPSGVFTSREFFDFELEAVWGREWFCVGHVGNIPRPGDYHTVQLGDEPLLVTRVSEDEVAVLSAVCQHRGMIIAEGPGHARRLRCPYHSWVYGLDGELRSAPDLNDASGFKPCDVRLPRLRSEVWEGFVFDALSDDIPPLAERLAPLSEQLAPWHVAEMRSPAPLDLDEGEWNWKVFADECYHCAYLHAGSWNRMFPTPSSAVDTDSAFNHPERGVIAYELIGREVGSMPTRTGKALHPFLPDLDERQLSRIHYVTVMPNLLIICMADKVKYFTWLPTGPTTSKAAFSWLFPESTMADPGFRERWEMESGDLLPVVGEDWAAWRGVQRGMHSRFAPRGQLAPTEAVLLRFNRWLIDHYRSADAAAGAAPAGAGVS